MQVRCNIIYYSFREGMYVQCKREALIRRTVGPGGCNTGLNN